MLKRAMMALIVTIVATIAFGFLYLWAGTSSVIFGHEWNTFLVAALLLVLAAFLCWQRFRWPETILLAFAVAFSVGCFIEVIVLFAFLHPEAWPWLTDQVFYLDTIKPSVWQPAQVLRGIGLCFPIPLFALVFDRLTTASNQAMQPTASPRTAPVSDD